MATLKSATNPPSREQLLAEVALEIQAMAQQKHNPLSGFKPAQDGNPGEAVLEELQAVQAIVAAKSTPDEQRRSGGGWSPRRKQPPTPQRRAASWASARSRSASGAGHAGPSPDGRDQLTPP